MVKADNKDSHLLQWGCHECDLQPNLLLVQTTVKHLEPQSLSM